MNLNNVSLIKLGNDSEIVLMKLGNGPILYQKNQLPLYDPNQNQFAGDETITDVEIMVNRTHIDLSNMFYGCTNLQSVNTTDWNTKNVTDMSWTFCGCTSLKELDLSNWDTGNVTTMLCMFEGCTSLKEISDLTTWNVSSNWNTSKVTNMQSMFSFCESLNFLNLANWDVSNVTDINCMFYYCESLQLLDLSNWDLSNVTNTTWMLGNCNKLAHLRLDNCSKDTISKIINSSDFPTGVLDNNEKRKLYCKKAKTTGLTLPYGWEFVYIEVPLYEPGKFRNNTTITKVETTVDESHTNLSYMFTGCTKLTTVNTEDWDTSNVTTMTYMFSGCQSLTELDLSSFDISRVTNMSNMFYNCTSLAELDLSNFNIKTSETVRIDYMLDGCDSLHTLRLDNCSKDTILKIIRESGMPTTKVNGETRKLYCKKDNKPALSTGEPANWEFVYVD